MIVQLSVLDMNYYYFSWVGNQFEQRLYQTDLEIKSPRKMFCTSQSLDLIPFWSVFVESKTSTLHSSIKTIKGLFA